MSKYDFDSEDKFVEFTVMGHTYQFWYPTTEEVLRMNQFKTQKDLDKYIFDTCIKKPEGSEAPDFQEIEHKMTVKQMQAFNRMIQTELGLG